MTRHLSPITCQVELEKWYVWGNGLPYAQMKLECGKYSHKSHARFNNPLNYRMYDIAGVIKKQSA